MESCPIGLEMFLGRMGPIRLVPQFFFGINRPDLIEKGLKIQGKE